MKSPSTLKATWWAQPTPGSAYWRCDVPARYLPGKVCELGWSDLVEDENGEVVMPRQESDISIWQFVGNATKAYLMAHAQDQGGLAFMEVDDNYLTPAPNQPNVLGPYGKNKTDWAKKLDRSSKDMYSIQAHRKILKWVDGVIVSTPYLAEQYARATSAPIFVCPNSVDFSDWPTPEKREDETRRIGYAGSDSHIYDLALIHRGLDYAWRQHGIELWKMGAKLAQWPFPYREFPWADDLSEYRRNLGILDVGLCPLQRGIWHDGKSDIKAMEYLLAGAVPIVQADSPAYADWVDIVPSAATEKDWLKQIKWACHASQDELDDVRKRGMEYIRAHKTIQDNIHKWEEVCTPQ